MDSLQVTCFYACSAVLAVLGDAFQLVEEARNNHRKPADRPAHQTCRQVKWALILQLWCPHFVDDVGCFGVCAGGTW